jgi:hypothetical protein
MHRYLAIVFVAAPCAFGLGAPAEKRSDVTLELELPGGVPPPPYAPDRVSRLEIDGKDFSTPRSTRRIVRVRPKPGADSVMVAYTFWPTIYMRITRTRTVKAGPGTTVKLSLMKPDKEAPDKIWVIYVPTPAEVVEAMAKLAKIGPDDVVYDVGCGDGRLVIHAVKERGAKRGVGIDLLPSCIKESRANAKAAGVEDRVTFQEKDALTIKDFSEATVVLLYLSNPLNEALRPVLRKTLKPGARIVSHRFLMGDWKPDRTETIRARDKYGRVKEFKLHLWTIRP